MRTRKISAGIRGLCVLCAVMVGALFTMISCTGQDKAALGASQPSSSGSSSHVASGASVATVNSVSSEKSPSTAVKAVAPVKVDIMTAANQSKFQKYAEAYYECFKGESSFKVLQGFSGSLTKKNGDGMIKYAILNDQTGKDLKQYIRNDISGQQGYYQLPQAVGDQVLKSCFDLRSIDHSNMSLYDAKKKAYVIEAGDFYSELSCKTVVKSVKQTGETVVSVVDYLAAQNSLNDATDKSKKLLTMRFTFKIADGKYVYEKAESL